MKAPAFLLYVRDIICSKTCRKLHSTHGMRGLAYLYLLCEGWLEEPPATYPMDHSQLAAMAHVSRDEWDEIWPILKHQFEEMENDRYKHVKQYEVWEAQQRRKRSGSKGGSKKQANRLANQVANEGKNGVANRKRRGLPLTATATAKASSGKRKPSEKEGLKA